MVLGIFENRNRLSLINQKRDEEEKKQLFHIWSESLVFFLLVRMLLCPLHEQ